MKVIKHTTAIYINKDHRPHDARTVRFLSALKVVDSVQVALLALDSAYQLAYLAGEPHDLEILQKKEAHPLRTLQFSDYFQFYILNQIAPDKYSDKDDFSLYEQGIYSKFDYEKGLLESSLTLKERLIAHKGVRYLIEKPYTVTKEFNLRKSLLITDVLNLISAHALGNVLLVQYKPSTEICFPADDPTYNKICEALVLMGYGNLINNINKRTNL